ncbi:MAG TPA: hypothetical protein VIT22_12875 [Pseudoxanthomonas sp.]
MFDAIIRQAAERFGLGGNAKQFVAQLLALIFNPGSGGISGFLQKFKDAGLGARQLPGSAAHPATTTCNPTK